jgi:GTP-binding protein LepA
MNNTRNFVIISHIDHGKSTLADRLLELTKTVEARKMREQVLDQMDIERERGITIKMQPVRMSYTLGAVTYHLNLIDTPGHVDFSYEVSRALTAVEGAILLVDATKGVQAQTLSVLAMAKAAGLVIIPAVNKIDLPSARVEGVKDEVAALLSCAPEGILEISGKTGQGVPELLSALIAQVPPPKGDPKASPRALVFDFEYSTHMGIVIYVRMFDGVIKRTDSLTLVAAKEIFTAHEVGVFAPERVVAESLSAGGIGYIVTGVKKAGIASVGDTITSPRDPRPPFPGYMSPKPVVWASVYPESQDDFSTLSQSLSRLKLSDPALTFEEEASPTLGRGFRCGLLGMLHLEIVMERLRREFNLELLVTTSTVIYELEDEKTGKREVVYSPAFFPEDTKGFKIFEPWVAIRIITPHEYLGPIMQLCFEHEAVVSATDGFGENRLSLSAEIPLRELMRNFFDELKSVSSGFASLAYEPLGLRKADVAKLQIFVAEEEVPTLSRIVSRRQIERDGEALVERLRDLLPREQFAFKIQAHALGRIIASRAVSALRKDVTGALYGGDITRKMKLLEKQKKGKKRMRRTGRVHIGSDVLMRVMRSGGRD